MRIERETIFLLCVYRWAIGLLWCPAQPATNHRARWVFHCGPIEPKPIVVA